MHSENFDAAISFAGEQRELARTITRQLTPLGYKMYYDHYYETWGEDLSELLNDIYGRIKVVVIIVSKEYSEKPWTKFERRAAVSNFIRRDGKLLQIKLDDIDLPGVPEVIQYKSYTGDNLHELCGSIISVVGPKKPIQLSIVNEQIEPIIKACYRRAIYTSMDSEVNTDAMFQSIRSCIGELNGLVPTTRNGSLSQYIKSIVKDLDSIDRYSKNGPNYTCLFKFSEKQEIDSLKIKILDKLHYLNYKFDGRVDLPDDIGLDYELRGYDFYD